MRHHHSTEHTHDNKHASFGKRRGHPALRGHRPINPDKEKFVDERKPYNGHERDDSPFNLLIGIGEKHDRHKKRSQHSSPYNRNIEQHFQCDGSTQNLCQRSRDGSQHRRTKNRTGYPFGSIFGGSFRKAKSGDNPQVSNIMLKDDQHNRGQGNHPQ